MGISSSWACCGFLLYLLALFLTPFRTIGTALPRGFLSPNSSTSWNTSFSAPNNTVEFDDGSIARSILVSENVKVPEINGLGYGCGCGFICNPPCNSFLFATFVLYHYKDDSTLDTSWGPHVVWSANPNNPVSANATLQFTSKSGLVLRNAGGTEVWSANITSKYVASLKLTHTCNLMFWDKNNKTIWRSHEHPTDTLFRGQKLLVGKSLTSKEGLFSLNIKSEGIFAYINSNPPQLYYSLNTTLYYDINIAGIEIRKGSIVLLNSNSKGASPELGFPGRLASGARYARFENDGHLRAYAFSPDSGDDILLATQLYSCEFPTACGNYGVCENKHDSCNQCTCPQEKNKNGRSYFKLINEREPDQGCIPLTNLSYEDEARKRQNLLEVENTTYFRFRVQDPDHIKPNHRNITLEKCKEECRKQCRCKAAIYHYTNRSKAGDCYLESQIYSMMITIPKELQYSRDRFKICIKVQDVEEQNKAQSVKIIVGSSMAFGLFLFIGSFVFLFWKKRSADEGEEYYLDHLPGMPTRYSYDDLQDMTENFNKKLGAGGFGTVFEEL